MILCPWKDIKKYASLLPGIAEAFDAVNARTDFTPGVVHPLSDGNRFFVAAQSAIVPDLAEAHRKYLDIQHIVKGKEVVGYLPLDVCSEEVAFPEDAHMPGRHLDVPNDFVKIEVKLKV